jgi:hypothetical protein
LTGDSLFTFNFKPMYKKGIFRVVVFLGALILCDFVFGMFSKIIFNSQKSGKYARLTYIVKADTSAIVVLGSSHALRHFVPEIIQDSLHEETFNYGTMGQKLLFNKAIYEIRTRRSKPKMIILNVDADWFVGKHDQQDRMSDLYPYYGSVGDIIFENFSRKDRFIGHLKFLSKTFPYNSTIVHVIKYKLKPQNDFNGYSPLYEVVDSLQLYSKLKSEKAKSKMKPVVPDCDSSLVNLFSQLIGDINKENIRLFVVFSPELIKPDYPEMYIDEKVKEVCKNRSTALLDFSNSDIFNNNRLLFSDFGHLNDSGARMFTKMLTDSIKLKTWMQ